MSTPVEVPSLPEAYESIPCVTHRHTPRRRAVARSMTLAAQVPTLTADVRVDLSQLMSVRADWGHNGGAAGRPSVLALIAWNAVRALDAFPALNASWSEQALLAWEPVNLAIAVDTPKGVVAPVIRRAETLNAAELTAAFAAVADRARGRGLSLADLEGGTFTISNPGAVGPAIRAEALLNVPQVALLGLPGIVRQPIVVGTGQDERVEIRSTISPSLTFDHRAIDGADAIRYLVALRDHIETTDAAEYHRAAQPDRRTS
ncbi:2-oxo acid dehydrogenase subunit E2 [Intrasporangium sp.]|uniref:2-oxo acid dehydrogenase subunit E2 n=1 Tax=Intrasporangium sp. TaxID=1925024 RepID=UPI003221A1E2